MTKTLELRLTPAKSGTKIARTHFKVRSHKPDFQKNQKKRVFQREVQVLNDYTLQH